MAAGRLADAAFADVTITIEADGGRGTAGLDYSSDMEATALRAAGAASRVAGGDFDLVRIDTTTFELRFYPGQRGRDLRTLVTFALERGNMRSPQYRRDRTGERTRAIVGGQGEAADRAVIVRDGPTISSRNVREVFVDARQETTTAGLAAQGDRALNKAQVRRELSFDVIQTPACLYGRDYTLGDLVAARFAGQTFAQQVWGVAVAYSLAPRPPKRSMWS